MKVYQLWLFIVKKVKKVKKVSKPTPMPKPGTVNSYLL